jgi:hypothetical protein
MGQPLSSAITALPVRLFSIAIVVVLIGQIKKNTGPNFTTKPTHPYLHYPVSRLFVQLSKPGFPCILLLQAPLLFSEC